MATSCVRDQSPRSCQSRQESPKPVHARPANAPDAFFATDIGHDSEWLAGAAFSSADRASAGVLDFVEYVDINPLGEFRAIRAWLQDRDAF
ncbi:hypothetical protein GRB70_39890 [Bradyrhizobium neotropicale]|nr:hypothetical protein [Bradyrhizobium neotropicale]